MMVWIKKALTPQEIRDRILDANSTFQKQLVEYLEAAHAGEFIGGTMEEIEGVIRAKNETHADRQDPTTCLPMPPPKKCNVHRDKSSQEMDCTECIAYHTWEKMYTETIDEILYLSNRHKHHPGCIDKKHESCKSRFPRDTYHHTAVDPDSGSILMKKGEAWLNTFSYPLSYLLRCNSDVTSLLSGTAIKSIVAYITDYITKSPLNTHVIFEAVKTIFDRNSSYIEGDAPREEKWVPPWHACIF
ncbi:hypothetical protein DENSPDRAFT_861946 [Dentipellis sp. KUC8613]|nr:hypothetical protein DENSPDRAFT_861946 [Dentipellis sp. KUC8613]